MPDQLLLYDTAVKTFVETHFANLIAGKSPTLMVGTPDRAFAEYVSQTPKEPDGRKTLPAIALTIGDPEVDNERFNSNDLRLLGFEDDETKLRIRKAQYPTPIRIPYTLNFWTQYQREMNLYVQKVLQLFRSQYFYLTVDIDSISPVPVYGSKGVGLFSEGGVNDTGDLEPGTNGPRVSRRTFAFHMKAWLWDLDFVSTPIVNEVEIQAYEDRELETVLWVASSPQRAVLGTGDGATTMFNLDASDRLPIVKKTLIIDVTIGGSVLRVFDNGAGGLVTVAGTEIDQSLSSVDYDTGEIHLVSLQPPDPATDISVAYYTTLEGR